MKEKVFQYRIDSEDTIVSISENWCAFADENAWKSSLLPEDVVGHRLWDFIQDIETKHLYQTLFRKVRGDMSSFTVPFRCDSPSERRYLVLRVEALPDRHLSITSTIARTEPRSSVSLLDIDTPRTLDFVTLCSMCKKMQISSEQWVEIEEGLSQLKLFENDKMPRLSHGLCQSCYQLAMEKPDAL